jgi:hypothetical protein
MMRIERFSDGVAVTPIDPGGRVTTIIERTPATRATAVKTSLLYLAFTTAWVYGFANGQHDLPGIVVLAFFLLPPGVHFLLGFALAKQEACVLLAYAPVLALVGPGLASSLFVPLAMLAVFPGAPLVLLGMFIRLRMEPREVEDHWF